MTFKCVEEMPGDEVLHEKTWRGPQKTINLAAQYEEHCQNPTKWPGCSCVCLWPNWNNQMKVGGPPVEPVLPAPRSLARLKLTREHQNWQVAHWYPVHFIDNVAGITSFIRLLSLNLLLPVKRTGRQVWQVAITCQTWHPPPYNLIKDSP